MNKPAQGKPVVEQKPIPKDKTQQPGPTDKATILQNVLSFVVAKAVKVV